MQEKTASAADRSKWWIFGVTSLANLVVSFSINSMNLALPTLAAEYGVSQNAVSWLTLVYSLIPSCTLLILGRLGDMYGYKRQFLFGFVFFGTVSLLTPFLAFSLEMLIFLRCLQGLGYSILISITQAITSRSFESSERGMALGINSVFVSVGLASGPSIGGILIEHFSWRSIFLFNVPFCVLGFLITSVVLKNDSRSPTHYKKDWAGSVLFALSIGLLIVGFNFGNVWGWLSVRFLLCFILSVCSMALFICNEKRVESPLMQLGLFKNAAFSLANGACLCSYLTQQMTTFLIPFYLINIVSLKSDYAGLLMLATPLTMMLSSPFGGRMADKYGTRLPAMLGLSTVAIGCGIVSLMTEYSGVAPVLATLFLHGVGNGYSVSAINTCIFSSVPSEQAGVASGMVATMRNLGQTLGVACGSVIIAMRQSVYSAGASSVSKSVYLMAERDAFYFGMAVTVIAMLMVYKIPADKKN